MPERVMTPESEKYAKIGKFDIQSTQIHAKLRNLIFPLQTLFFASLIDMNVVN